MTPTELRARRLVLGLTQLQMARELGMDQSNYAKWELGKVRIGRPKQLTLALDALEQELRIRRVLELRKETKR